MPRWRYIDFEQMLLDMIEERDRVADLMEHLQEMRVECENEMVRLKELQCTVRQGGETP